MIETADNCIYVESKKYGWLEILAFDTFTEITIFKIVKTSQFVVSTYFCFDDGTFAQDSEFFDTMREAYEKYRELQEK